MTTQKGPKMDDFRAGVRLRRVCRELRRWRTQHAGLKNSEAAKLVGWSTGKLSRVENAMQPIAPIDVLSLGLVYKVPEQERDRLFQAAHTAQERGWWNDYELDELVPVAQDFVELESEARLVRTYKLDLVPGLFQIPEYVEALVAGDIEEVSEETVRKRSQSRAPRQALLYANPPLKVEAVIWEPALRQLVGGRKVMLEQLRRLTELAELPHVTVQILPLGGGAYPVMGSPFEILSFEEQHYPDVVYVENRATGVYLEDPKEVEQYNRSFAALRSVALDPGRSLDLVSLIAEDLK